VHVAAGDIPDESLEDIREHLRAHRHVFTTSYDLLLYWASAKGADPKDPFGGMRETRDLKLLDQSGHPFHGDHTARPLIVTEASDANKRRSIKSNDYLNYCWERLKEVDCPMVVFGHSMSDEDTHLADALNAHPRRPVAVSLVDGGRDVNRDEQLRITRKLRTTELHFFDTATHPLGSEHLAVLAL
jgi:hypothetical protein